MSLPDVVRALWAERFAATRFGHAPDNRDDDNERVLAHRRAIARKEYTHHDEEERR